MIVLIVLGSIAGAVSVVAGLMLLAGSLNSADFTRAAFTESIKDSWGWYLTLLVLAFLGIIIQARQRAVMCRTIHQYWRAEAP
jgi:cytosine/uracil/thiamine/allantoin permease